MFGGVQDRQYVSKERGALKAQSRGRVLTAFLETYFARYLDYGFTSGLEEQLDEVSGAAPCIAGVRCACRTFFHL